MDEVEQAALDASLIEPLTVPAPVSDRAGQQRANVAARRSHNKVPYPDAGFPEDTPPGLARASADQPKQRRKRRTKAEMEALRSFEAASDDASDATVAAPAKRSGGRRPTGKLTGDDVTQGVTLAFAGVAMLTRQAHWAIDPREVKPWASEAAELLNRIPAKYVRAVTDMSGYLIVGTGVYGCVAPRLAESQRIAAEKRAAALAARQAEAVNGAQEHINSNRLEGVPW